MSSSNSKSDAVTSQLACYCIRFAIAGAAADSLSQTITPHVQSDEMFDVIQPLELLKTPPNHPSIIGGHDAAKRASIKRDKAEAIEALNKFIQSLNRLSFIPLYAGSFGCIMATDDGRVIWKHYVNVIKLMEIAVGNVLLRQWTTSPQRAAACNKPMHLNT